MGDARQSAAALWVQLHAPLWAALLRCTGGWVTHSSSLLSFLCAAETHLLADLCQSCTCLDMAAVGEAHSP